MALTSNKLNGFSFFPSFQCSFFEWIKIQVHKESHSLKCRGLQSRHYCFNTDICPRIVEFVELMQVLSIQQQCTLDIRGPKGQKPCNNFMSNKFISLIAWHTCWQWTVSVIVSRVIVLRFFGIFLLCSLEEINAQILNDMEKATPSTAMNIITLPLLSSISFAHFDKEKSLDHLTYYLK